MTDTELLDWMERTGVTPIFAASPNNTLERRRLGLWYVYPTGGPIVQAASLRACAIEAKKVMDHLER